MIPECDLELSYGTLGGKYTTIEGLLGEILDNFKKNNPFMGDSDV
jgi:zinc finger protein